MRREVRLYRCWASAREVEVEVDEISFSYAREAQGPAAVDMHETGGTGQPISRSEKHEQ